MKFWKPALAVGLLGLASGAQAGLIDRGNGLIYDTVLDITWLQDANWAATSSYATTNEVDNGPGATDNILADGRMGWDAAVAWADQLVYQGYDNWRLPTLGPIGAVFDYGFSTNATTDRGYADSAGWVDGSGVPVSEMGHMYYVNLANLGYCPPDGGDGDPSTCDGSPQAGWGLNNTSFVDELTGATVDFLHVQPNLYWSGLECAPNPSLAWDFLFGFGFQVAAVSPSITTRGLCAPAMSPPPRCLARRC